MNADDAKRRRRKKQPLFHDRQAVHGTSVLTYHIDSVGVLRRVLPGDFRDLSVNWVSQDVVFCGSTLPNGVRGTFLQLTNDAASEATLVVVPCSDGIRKFCVATWATLDMLWSICRVAVYLFPK